MPTIQFGFCLPIGAPSADGRATYLADARRALDLIDGHFDSARSVYMATTLSRQRTYAVSPELLAGACLTALGRTRAAVERQDLAHGAIVAVVGGGGPLALASELALEIAPVSVGCASLSVTWRARKLGGDRAILPAFLASVDSLVSQA